MLPLQIVQRNMDQSCTCVWDPMHHLIISNGEMAMEVLKVHDAEFASRPIVIAEKYLGLNWSTITFSHYGDH